MKYANFDHMAAVRKKVNRILKLYESRFVLLICQEMFIFFIHCYRPCELGLPVNGHG